MSLAPLILKQVVMRSIAWFKQRIELKRPDWKIKDERLVSMLSMLPSFELELTPHPSF